MAAHDSLQMKALDDIEVQITLTKAEIYRLGRERRAALGKLHALQDHWHTIVDTVIGTPAGAEKGSSSR